MTLVYTDNVAATLFWSTFLAFVLLDVRLITNSLAGRANPDESERGLIHRPAGLMLIIAAETTGIAAAAIGAAVVPWRWGSLAVGLTLAWAGLALRFTAKRTLGRFFVGAIVIQADHRVVADGPYATIRHPGYAGSLCTLIGLGIGTANVLTFVLLTTVPAYIFVRTIQREEATLVSALGEDYSNYRQRTSRLIPGVW